jgi:hypothetical protein
MIFTVGLRPVCCVIAVAMMISNLFDMNLARASSEHRQPAHAEAVHDHLGGGGVPQGCCDTMHSWSTVPCIPALGFLSAIRQKHYFYVEIEQPLLLVKSIDAPSTSAVS